MSAAHPRRKNADDTWDPTWPRLRIHIDAPPGWKSEVTGRYQDAVLASVARSCYTHDIHPLEIVAVMERNDAEIGVVNPHTAPPLARAWAATNSPVNHERLTTIARTIYMTCMEALEGQGMEQRDITLRCPSDASDIPVQHISAQQQPAVIDHLVARLADGDARVAAALAQLGSGGTA